MEINQSFVNRYLTCGMTVDNFIFENCPRDFLDLAYKKLSVDDNNILSCCVVIKREDEKQLEKVLESFSSELYKRIIARDYLSARVINEIYNKFDGFVDEKQFLQAQIKAFQNADFDKVKEMHKTTFMLSDVADIMKDVGKLELNFFLYDNKNVQLQQAINLLVSCREPYSVKIFTNNEHLPTYYDQAGLLIEAPHDFMRRDVNQFIESQK